MTDRVLSKRYSKNWVSRLIDQAGPFKCLLILYALFVLIQMVVNGYCKHLETYQDEWIYYGIAQSLAKGMGFPAIYGEAYTGHTRFLYSLLIASGLLTSNRLLQFKLIAMLNALMIGSGVFPTYLLSKRVLKDNTYSLLACLIYLLQPDMEFTATFMTENLWIPVALWTIWFFFELISEEKASVKRRVVTVALLFVSAAILVNIKSAGIPIIFGMGLYFLISNILKFIRNDQAGVRKIWGLAWGIALCVVLVVVFVVLNQYQDIGDRVTSSATTISSHIKTKPFRYMWCYCYTWATEILAMGIFPFILPLLSFRKLNKPAKELLILALLITLVANISVANTSLGTTDSVQLSGFRLHQRYVAYLWILYFIPFLYVIYHEVRLPRSLTGICVVATLAFCIVFEGAIIGSAVDTSLLYWAVEWIAHRKLWIVAVVLFVCVGLLLLKLDHKRAFRVSFFCIMLAVVAYDHYVMHGLLQSAYGFDYSGIEETERFVRNHPDDTFLVVTLPNVTSGENSEIHYNTKVADTFLVYPNTIFASGKKIAGIQTDQGIDLNEVRMDDTGISVIGPRNIESVDYVVLTTEMLLDESKCEPIVGDSYFSICHLNEATKIPYMQNYNNWYLPGKTTLRPEAGFSSNYFEGDNMVYVSGENPDYVLYGPRVSLRPGRYTVIVNYSNEGDASGKIGTMELAGSALDSSRLRKDVFSNQGATTITFDITERCDAFEVRLFADVPGIRVNSIDVEMLSFKRTNAGALEVFQFRNSNGLLNREEFYTASGEEAVNPNGCHAIDYSYLYGNRAVARFYDSAGKLVNTKSGFALVRYTYDNRRQIVLEEYFDVANNPVVVNPGGYHAIETVRDANGDATYIRYLGEHDEEVTVPLGYAAIKKEYDDARRVIREEFYGIAGSPIMRTDGFFAVEYKFDSKGNNTELKYYDLSGQLSQTTGGYAILRKEYNGQKQVTREEYFGLSGEPVAVKGIYAKEYNRDAAGHAIEERYYGSDKRLQDNSSGFARVVRTYDSNGKLIEEKLFHADGTQV